LQFSASYVYPLSTRYLGPSSWSSFRLKKGNFTETQNKFRRLGARKNNVNVIITKSKNLDKSNL